MDALKDHQVAAFVNTLRDIAVEYHGAQQLRERIAHAVRAALPSDAAQAPIGEVVDFRETAFASIPVIAWEVKPELGAKLYAAPVARAAAAPSEDAYVAQRMTETLAEVYATIIDADAQQEDESLNAIERVKRAAQVLRLEVDLYRAQREAEAPHPDHIHQAVKMVAQPDERAAFDIEAMLKACVPGGSICDPQIIADSLREWFAARATASQTTRIPIYQIGANAGGGIAWWDVTQERYEAEKKVGYMNTCIVYREAT